MLHGILPDSRHPARSREERALGVLERPTEPLHRAVDPVGDTPRPPRRPAAADRAACRVPATCRPRARCATGSDGTTRPLTRNRSPGRAPSRSDLPDDGASSMRWCAAAWTSACAGTALASIETRTTSTDPRMVCVLTPILAGGARAADPLASTIDAQRSAVRADAPAPPPRSPPDRGAAEARTRPMPRRRSRPGRRATAAPSPSERCSREKTAHSHPNQRAQRRELRRADPPHVEQVLDPPEPAVRAPVVHDRLRGRGAHPGKGDALSAVAALMSIGCAVASPPVDDGAPAEPSPDPPTTCGTSVWPRRGTYMRLRCAAAPPDRPGRGRRPR